MLLVVADTSPLRYLVQIGHIQILPQLFDRIFIPAPVYEELRHPKTPAPVTEWAQDLPGWLEVLPAPSIDDPSLSALDLGERAALALGLSMRADIILIDERKGVAVAREKGFQATGTLGLLTRAAQRGLIDLAEAFGRLRTTNFRHRPELMDSLLDQHKRR